MALAYIGLGSNLADPQAQIAAALAELEQLEHWFKTARVRFIAFSRNSK